MFDSIQNSSFVLAKPIDIKFLLKKNSKLLADKKTDF